MPRAGSGLRAPDGRDAATLGLGAMLVLAESGAPREQLQLITGLFSDDQTDENTILEHLEEIRIEGQQIFRRERDDDALVWDFERIDASQRDVVLALIARAIQLQGTRTTC